MEKDYKYYHLYNRGCNRELIFFKDDHYRLLLRKIKENYQRFSLRIIAYCLMPNHYHLMVGVPVAEPSEGLNMRFTQNGNLSYQLTEGSVALSRFMQRVFNGYVQAVNIDMHRKGTLFESKYKSIVIDKEEYLLQLVRYIHINPVLAGLCTNPEDWEYSNCKEWLGLRKGILFDSEFFGTYFQTNEQYREFINSYKEEKLTQKEIKRFWIDW
ncbi:MAG TPA: transposase [Candidatus Marinimicrobia bacterium]|nr:transposase [Candidatus Neomarinimicrobiota bacterium]HRS51714.1 transposase [Candidatus Neomarinimicrobiota bacterium]HRU92136.1 transposase [Candidatus Neomarinimicrobiota bacterium]